jgi:hypothetical protein
MVVEACVNDIPRQMVAYRLKSIAGKPFAVVPGVLHGLPTGGSGVAGGVVLTGDGLDDGEGLGDGDAVCVAVGEGVRVFAVSSGAADAHAPSARTVAAAKTTILVRCMDTELHSRAWAACRPCPWAVCGGAVSLLLPT